MNRIALVLCAALSLGGTLAYAGDHKMERRSHRDSRYVDDYTPRRTTGKAYRTRRGDYRRDPRWDNDGRGVPPGLAKKPGGMPPGQYKKYRDRD